VTAEPTVIDGLDAVRAAAGLDLGTTDWVALGEDQPARFAASLRLASGPPSVPVAMTHLPEFLVLSLTNLFLPMLVEVRGVALGINYGTGAVHFAARAPLGSRLRASGRVNEVLGLAGGAQTTIRVTVEAEGVAVPVCVVDAISRWMA
jgi:hypothetical protein